MRIRAFPSRPPAAAATRIYRSRFHGEDLPAVKAMLQTVAPQVEDLAARKAWVYGVLDRLFFERDAQRRPIRRTQPDFELAQKIIRHLAHEGGTYADLTSYWTHRGIFVVFARQFVDHLTGYLRGAVAKSEEAILEISAGDGALSQALRGRKLNMIATDNHSWFARPGESWVLDPSVEKRDAAAAIAHYKPRVVVGCRLIPEVKIEEIIFRNSDVQVFMHIGHTHFAKRGGMYVAGEPSVEEYGPQHRWRVRMLDDAGRFMLHCSMFHEFSSSGGVTVYERIAKGLPR